MAGDELAALLDGLDDDAVAALVDELPVGAVAALLDEVSGTTAAAIPAGPLAQAIEIDPGYRTRPHLEYLSQRLAKAVHDVEQGRNRYLMVQMPPRSGKSQLSSVFLPVWLLRTHPKWKIGLVSHTPHLAVNWGRQVRRVIEEHGPRLGLRIAKDAGAAADWETMQRGGITSRSAPGQSLTGLGFRVLIVDDAVKDFATAHSAAHREALWDWWRANSRTRLEPPHLVIAVATRWHEDDFLGRLLSPEHDGDPRQWEVISFPAIAEESDEPDVLGRQPGQPLYSPLLDETEEEALARWADIRSSVGSYAWAALYQQHPAPAQGAIFNTNWWRYWTSDPSKADGDRVLLLNPGEDLKHAAWLDSWDMAFKATSDSDFVVGQRWARQGANRFLIAQQRGRWTFTETLERMRDWGDGQGPHGNLVHKRLVEDKANGTAILDTLRNEISGLKPISPGESKEARARAVTPEVEAGNVLLPLPTDPGNQWVGDLLDELRDFNSAAHDDQVDALTQALSELRGPGHGLVTVPGRGPARIERQLSDGKDRPGGTINGVRTPRPAAVRVASGQIRR